MAIDIPSDLELLLANALAGHIPADDEPLHTLMRRINWHYATHSPALINFCPLEAPGSSVEYIVPAVPSADGLDYTTRWRIYVSVTGSVDIDVQYATTYGGSYSSCSGFPQTTSSLTAGDNAYSKDTIFPSTARFFKVRVYNGAGNVQLQSFGAYPKKKTVIYSGTRPSGFVAYDDAALKYGSGAGAPIHTEYFERAVTSLRSTQLDRRQCLWSYVQNQTTGTYGFSSSSYATVHRVAIAGFFLPVTETTDVTVYAKCADSGAGSGTLIVGQVGSERPPVKFTADDVEDDKVLKIDPDRPQALYANAVDPSSRMDPRYIIVEWRPSIGSSKSLLGSVAPPPHREYLDALDSLSLEACAAPYACTGLNMNAALAGTGYWYCGQRIGPAAYAMQPLLTISRNDAASVGGAAEFWALMSGTDPADKIVVDSPIGGALVYPPNHLAQVVEGSTAWDDSPTGTGSYRLMQITADREPAWETIYGRYYCGWAGRPRQVSDLSSLP